MKTVFCFAGQGSHYYKMGEELFNNNQIFRSWMEKLDKVVFKQLGVSLIEVIYKNDKKESASFNRTLYTHPAIFMVEYSLSMVLIESGIKPDFVLGTSLGEFAAITVASGLQPEIVLTLIIDQAKILEKNCLPGGMIAILDSEQIFKENDFLYNCVELAGTNYHNHFIVSGGVIGIQNAIEGLKQKNIPHFNLPVSSGFHSSLIDPAKQESVEQYKNFQCKPIQIPIISCCYQQILNEIPASFFWDIIRKPISFKATIKKIFDTNECFTFIDASPSGSLVNFLKNLFPLKNTNKFYVTLNQYGNDLKNLDMITNDKKYQKNNKAKDNKMIAFVFPGQGSQTKGMGKELFNQFPELVKKADEILGFSIEKLCLEDPNSQLKQTQYTQPALYIIGAMSYLAKIKADGIIPDFLAGHSLGEYSALFASKVFDFETGLKIVKERGRLMSQVTGGAMAAVIGLEDEKVRSVLEKYNLDSIDIANLNSPGQVVISGLDEHIKKSQQFFEKEGAKLFVHLQVSGAFHSRYMENVSQEFDKFLSSMTFDAPTISVISNVTARPYTATTLKKLMVEQITKSVKWTESVRYLMGCEVNDFNEIGIGDVLTKLITKIKSSCKPIYPDVEKEIIEELQHEDNVIKLETSENISFEKDSYMDNESIVNKNKMTIRSAADSQELNTDLYYSRIVEDVITMTSNVLKIDKKFLNIDNDLSEYNFNSLAVTELSMLMNNTYDSNISPVNFFGNRTMRSFISYLLKSNQEKILRYYKNHNNSQLKLDSICTSGGKPNRKHLILLSARNKSLLKIYVENLLNYLESKLDNEKLIPDIEYFLIFEREIMKERLALVIDDLNDLVCKLNDFNSGKKEIGGLFNNGNGMNHSQINLFMSDSDAKELLFKWINCGDIDKVAHLWLHGIPIDWNTIFGKHTYSVILDKEFPVPHSE